MNKDGNRYEVLIAEVFLKEYLPGSRIVAITREALVASAANLGIRVPKNVGDILYAFRYRNQLPREITERAPEGTQWIIMPAGHGRYNFEAVRFPVLEPALGRSVVKIPNATPSIILAHAQSDEQALLAILRYNRLIDIFIQAACYSLQSHLRTTVRNLGQIEVDEVYLGIDKRGEQYVIPVQAKGGKDKHSPVQIRQDISLCLEKFPSLTCRPVGAQFMGEQVIALMEFDFRDGEVQVAGEQHYRLVHPSEITEQDLAAYRLPRLGDS